MEYIVLTSYTSKELSEKVDKRLADGWVLQGGVSYAVSEDTENSMSYYFAQAMVRAVVAEKEESPELSLLKSEGDTN